MTRTERSKRLKSTSIPVKCPMDEFENAVRKFGVIAACEWFGHIYDSDFTGWMLDAMENERDVKIGQINVWSQRSGPAEMPSTEQKGGE